MEANREEQFTKLLELEKKLGSVKAMRKSMLSDYKDQIKEIESEIKEMVSELGGE